MEALFCLGMGIGRIRSLMPRELWKTLPGGMPYYAITKEKYAVEIQDGPEFDPTMN